MSEIAFKSVINFSSMPSCLPIASAADDGCNPWQYRAYGGDTSDAGFIVVEQDARERQTNSCRGNGCHGKRCEDAAAAVTVAVFRRNELHVLRWKSLSGSSSH